MNVPRSALENDAAIIKRIFPERSVEEITRQLQEISNVENRVQIVVERLLRLNDNSSLKRASPNHVEGKDAVASKRPKLTCATVVSGESSRDEVILENVLPSTSAATDSEMVIQDAVTSTSNSSSEGAPNEVILENVLPSTSAATDSEMVVQDAVTSTSNSSSEGAPTSSIDVTKSIVLIENLGKTNIAPIEDVGTNSITAKVPEALQHHINEVIVVPPPATVVNQHQPTVSLQPTQLMPGSPPRFFREDRNKELDDVEEVADIEQAVADNALVCPLMEIFPEACPRFIRNICMGKVNAPGVLDNLISRILELESYPKRQKAASPERQLNSEEQLEILKQLLPDADPSYLQIHCDRLIDRPNELKLFIEQAVEYGNYPTMKDYLRKQQLSAQEKQYTTEFDMKKFLEVIPNPTEYFNDPKRKPANINMDSHHYALCFLRNHFNQFTVRGIKDIFRKKQENFLLTCKTLETVSKPEYYLMNKRGVTPMPSAIQNIPLLQEIAYYTHRLEIETFLTQQKKKEANERKEAKQAGLLQTCSCCYDEEVMPKEIYMCESGCKFCKDCVRKGAEVAFGDGKLDFACLVCSSHFSLQTLQAVLQPKMFSKVALKKQLEEVKAAGIEDLEMCPFCDFASIPAKEDKLFHCFNPECMKESCRLCKEPSHVPLRCEEVEKDDDVKRRTYIENKMTEALLRECYKCGMKFIKSEGCNKMTCSCGALMCYVCGEPVKDYKHFNGPGGDKTHLCPLYSDTNRLHQEAVLKGASEAKHEIGVTDPAQLKIDPTADIQQHYEEFARENPSSSQPRFVPIDPLEEARQDRAIQEMEEHRQRRRERDRNRRNRRHHHHQQHQH